jgi:hypothetical protein
LLSVLSPRESRFKDEAVKVPKWILNAIKTTKEKEALDSDVLLNLVRGLRETMVGSWIQIKARGPYFHDINLFVDSVLLLANNTKRLPKMQRNIRLNDKPCHTANDTVAFTCDYIGRSGILSDERHNHLSCTDQHGAFSSFPCP